MSNKILGIFRSFSYTFSSNLISLLISTLVILIVPKLVGVEDYGYWQLYLFYTSYIGFFHLGWNDGIYLRYGGKQYKDLNKKTFSSQFYMQLLSQIIIFIFLIIFSRLTSFDGDKEFIIQMTGICLVLSNSQSMLSFIFQATNRIKEYAQVTTISRVAYITLLFTFLSSGIRDYKYMIVADLIGRFVSLLLAMYYCKEIVFTKFVALRFDYKEMFNNINVGIKLMFSNIASMLIIGIVRFGIERKWDVETFGKVSLTLSISNMMMLFINALGIIIFPLLRRTSKNKYHDIYIMMRDFLMVVTLGILIAYYPIKSILSIWLPQYADALKYMAILFPMFVYEGKTSLLINSYLKTLRKEKVMLVINLFTVSLSFICSIIFILLLENLNLSILSIVILLAFRSIIAEFYISSILNLKLKKDIILEIILTIIFILSGWYVNSWITTILYGVSYFIYLLVKKKDIKRSLQIFKSVSIAKE